ncbi:MAG TPA: hypothetical protein VMP13_04710 [Acidimicrobiia bacterium]|nr:hypothetical protein [Acidimicrobiia bacterium]
MIEARLVTFEDAHQEGVTLTGVGPGYPPEETDEWAGSVTAVGAAIIREHEQ